MAKELNYDLTPRLMYTPGEVGYMLALSIEQVQQLLDSGELRSAVIAGQRLIHKIALLELTAKALKRTRREKRL